MSAKRAHLVISGHVQGVSYRWSAQEEARRRGLTGWVRNLPSGEVEATVEGPAAEVAAFVAWCRQGPPAAQVEDVRVTETPATGEFATFDVRRDLL